MFKLIKKSTRPDPNTPFFNETREPSEEFKNYVYENYFKTGKMLQVKRELSEDKSQFIMTVEWASHEAFMEFISDDVCVKNSIGPNEMYDNEKDITSEFLTDQE
jgi:hypothetical protein